MVRFGRPLLRSLIAEITPRVLAALAGALLCIAPAVAHAARPVAAEDIYKLAFVSDPQISPDGARVVFVVSHANGPKNRYDTDLYLASTSAGGARRITTSGRDSDPAWSPDGSTVAFVRGPSKKGEHPQIFTYAVSSGSVKQLTHVKTGAFGPLYSHDGKHIAFGSVTVDPVHDAYIDFKAAGFTPTKEQRKTDVRIIKQMHFEENGAGYTYDRHPHIWVMNADGSGVRALTSGTTWSEGNPQWSPDDKTIAFNSLRYYSPSSGPSDIYTMPATGGAMRKLPSLQPANYLLGYDRAGHIWYLRGSVGDPAQFPALVRADANGANARVVVARNTVQFGDTVLADMGEPGGICGPQFAPQDRFAISDVDEPGYSSLAKVDTATGSVTPLTNGGEDSECTMDRGGRYVAYTHSDFTHPREVYVLDLATGKSRRLSGLNDAYLANVELSKPQEFTVTDDAGYKVQAWFMPAIGAHGKRPTMLNIHGGPQTQFGNSYFDELQYWAGQGYNVVFSDPRGSVGHGYSFEAALNGHWGEAMFDDVQRVMDAAVQRPEVDANNLTVSGGSYGGYATLWVISHTNRYKTAIAERAVSNLVSEQLAADFASDNGFGSFAKYGFGDPWNPNTRNYIESPLTFVENVHTPLFILHSEDDTRTPVDQTEQEFNALKILGKTVQYVDFPDENHDLSRTGSPLHRVERLHLEDDWLHHWLK